MSLKFVIQSKLAVLKSDCVEPIGLKILLKVGLTYFPSVNKPIAQNSMWSAPSSSAASSSSWTSSSPWALWPSSSWWLMSDFRSR